MRWMGTVLATLLAGVAWLASPSTVDAEVGGTRLAVRNPFWQSSARTGNELPQYHPGSATVGSGKGWDIYVPSDYSPEVYLSAASIDGKPTAYIVDRGLNSNGAGKWVMVEYRVNGAPVGRVRYNHLKSISDGIVDGKTYDLPRRLGNLPSATDTYPTSKCKDGGANGWPWSSKWQVCTKEGVHVHLEWTRGCYRALDINQKLNKNTDLLMLSTKYSTANLSKCDSNEIKRVSLRKYASRIVQWDGDTKPQTTSWWVNGNMERFWIPSIPVYQCLDDKPPVILTNVILDQLRDTGKNATC